MPLINCEKELILVWSKNCALVDMTARATENNNVHPAIVAPTGLVFQLTDNKIARSGCYFAKRKWQKNFWIN